MSSWRSSNDIRFLKMLQKIIASKKCLKHYATTHRSERNRTKYNFIRNKVKKVVARIMRMEAEKEIEAFFESRNKFLGF